MAEESTLSVLKGASGSRGLSEAAASRVGILGEKRSVRRRKAVSCGSGSRHLADERPWRLAPESVRVQCVQCLLWVLWARPDGL